MTKLKKETLTAPKCDSLQVLNKQRGKLTRSKNVDHAKNGTHSLKTSSELMKLCIVKLRRFKVPNTKTAEGPASSKDLVQPLIVTDKAETTSINTTKQCRVRVNRVRCQDFVKPTASLSTIAEKDKRKQRIANRNTQHSTKRKAILTTRQRSMNMDALNTNCTNQSNVLQMTTIYDCESQGKNMFPFGTATDSENNFVEALTSSTPIRASSSIIAVSKATPLQREPFKELNQQHQNYEFENTVMDTLSKTQTIITKEKRECLRKLSLTKPWSRRKPNIVNPGEISRFEPLINSTLWLPNIAKSTENKSINIDKAHEIVERSKQVKKQLATHKSRKQMQSEQTQRKAVSTKNLAGKTHLIEQLLLSDTDENHVTVDQPAVGNKTQNRFFHRTIQAAEKVRSPLKKSNAVTQQKNRIKKLRDSLKRTSVGNVFDFFSQSQTSDSESHKDPAADIIKKLIATGRVRVATNKKGTGKLTIKRNPIIRKRAAVQAKQKKVLPKKLKKNTKDYNKILPTPADVGNNINDIQSQLVDLPGDASFVAPSNAHPQLNIRQAHDNSAGGTFSNLARSVIISQAGKNEKSRKKQAEQQRKLLEVARKFVSTPINNKISHLEKTSNLSPISGQPHCPAIGDSSPWRVNDANLPSVFNFSRNSANLPSFSSDFIPPTPRKQQQSSSRIGLQTTLSKSVAVTEDAAVLSATKSIEIPLCLPATTSFSSNDSNAENMPPLTPATAVNGAVGDITDANVAIFNNRQQTNPRRALSYRSPLKTINILEVITLPPLIFTTPNSNTERNEKASSSKVASRRMHSKTNVGDLFGFEEFLDDNDSYDKEEEVLMDRQVINENSNNQSLRDKLHKLKHMRPTTEEVIHPTTFTEHIRAVFDDDEGRHANNRQLRIKEMLCSTMISPLRANEQAIRPKNYKINCEAEICSGHETNELSQLFKDPDPAVSFDEKNPRRTYVRPYKRKRKLRHNFVMFLDSDESGDELDENRSHETSSEADAGHKKKRPKKDVKSNLKLNSFVNDFNEMCKEVDQYELIVE